MTDQKKRTLIKTVALSALASAALIGCGKKEEPAPAPAPAPEVITLNDQGSVMFAYDSAELTPAAQQQLRTLTGKLNDPSVASIKVIGHTDSRGSDAYNQALSERRANAVRDVLVNQHGIDSSRVSSVGYGESRPVADNDSESGRAINRRVEAEVEAQP